MMNIPLRITSAKYKMNKIANSVNTKFKTINKTRASYPAKYYLALHSTDHQKWRERWEVMIVSKRDNYSHLKFDEFPISEPNDRGKFFMVDNVDSEHKQNILRTAKSTDIEQSDVWILPGTFGTSREGMLITLQEMSHYLSDVSHKFLNGARYSNPLLFCSDLAGQDRYKEAMGYLDNPNEYFSKSAERFVRKYLISRVIKGQKTTFITYSIGGKELVLIENALRYLLINEYGYDDNAVQGMFKNIYALCIGHAPEINLNSTVRFSKYIILSASDQCAMIAKSLYTAIYHHKICQRPFSIFRFNDVETVFFLGHQSAVAVLNNKLNHDGHRLPHYLESTIRHLPNSFFTYLQIAIFRNNMLCAMCTRHYHDIRFSK